MPKTIRKCRLKINTTRKKRDIPKLKRYNKHTEAYLDTKLIKTLTSEFTSKTKQANELPRTKFHKYEYSMEFKKKDNYGRIHIYKDNKKSVLLDYDVLAKKHDFFQIDTFTISNDESMVAYTVDVVGSRFFDIYLKHIDCDKPQLIITKCAGEIVFGSESRYIYYIKYDKRDLRPAKLCVYDTCTKKEKLLYHETNRSRFLDINNTSDMQHIIMTSKFYNEYTPYLVNCNGIEKICDTKAHVRVNVDHWLNKWYFFKRSKSQSTILVGDDLKNLKPIITHKKNQILENMFIKGGYLIVTVKKTQKRELIIYDLKTNKQRRMRIMNQKYELGFPYISNLNIYDEVLTLEFTTFINPTKVLNLNLRTLKMTEIYDFKTELYNPNKYNENLVQINNHVYISILSAKSKTKHNKPCVLYGYGSYGVNLEPSFDPAIISLLDRGFYYCIAHIRGSSIDGYSSWLAGKMLNKKNTFKDFITAGEWLLKNNYTTSDKLTIWGRSAGGLLVGNVINQKPQMANLAILGVPFVDVLGTMTDTCQPLVTEEYKEWGNPNNKKTRNYMKSYDPMLNINPNAKYPNIYIYSNLNDTLVQYDQVLKYYERISKSKVFINQERKALLNMKLKYGHTQATKKNEKKSETAEIYSLILKFHEGK